MTARVIMQNARHILVTFSDMTTQDPSMRTKSPCGAFMCLQNDKIDLHTCKASRCFNLQVRLTTPIPKNEVLGIPCACRLARISKSFTAVHDM